MPRKPKGSDPLVLPSERPQEKTKTKRTIDPNSPAGIRNAWASATTQYRKAKESVRTLESDLAAAREDLANAASRLSAIGAKVKALLPTDEAKP